MKHITLTLFAASLLVLQTRALPPGEKSLYAAFPLIEETANNTRIELLPLAQPDINLVQVKNFSSPLTITIYTYGEKVERSLTITAKEQVTTLNLQNLSDEYYILRIHSDNGEINYVYKLNRKETLLTQK